LNILFSFILQYTSKNEAEKKGEEKTTSQEIENKKSRNVDESKKSDQTNNTQKSVKRPRTETKCSADSKRQEKKSESQIQKAMKEMLQTFLKQHAEEREKDKNFLAAERDKDRAVLQAERNNLKIENKKVMDTTTQLVEALQKRIKKVNTTNDTKK